MKQLPLRQLHLDFHNSPHLPDIAAGFDPGRFVADLRGARVASVTCFSRCHHGLIYHDTGRFPELKHPHLTRDLLGEQIQACHGAGIRVPIYITVGWDDIQRRAHPQWLERDEAGNAPGPGPLEAGFDQKLCLGSGYVDFVVAQTTEVLDRFPCDGFFFDIVHQGPCLCQACLERMADSGLDPASPEDRQRNAEQVLDAFKARMTDLVRGRAPEATIFYNAGHVGPETKRCLDQVSHLELESLPGGHWGYLHFPMTVRYARNLGRPLVGMTAAFHGSWGDFGAPKARASLEHDCFQMLSQGAGCSVGDQLLPDGTFDPANLALLGQVYAEVERKEPWCAGATAQAEIGVFYPEAFGASDGQIDSSAAGAMAALTEGHHQFDFIDGGADLRRYKVILVPDRIRMGAQLGESLGAYLEGGGALILCHLGGLSPEGDFFTLPQVGAECLGISPHEPDFLVPGPALAAGLPETPLAMKWRAMRVRPEQGTEVLAGVKLGHFERSWRRFTSHLHAPPASDADYPAATRRDRVIYFAHPILSMYRQQAWPWCRDLLLNALSLLLPEPLVRADIPRACQVTVTRQDNPRREVVHLFSYLPRLVGEQVPTVDEVLPLHDLKLNLRQDSGAAPRSVTLQPQGVALPFTHDAPYVSFTVPRLEGHQLIEII